MNTHQLANVGVAGIALGVLWTGILWALFTPMHALAGIGVFSLGVVLFSLGALPDDQPDDSYRYDP